MKQEQQYMLSDEAIIELYWARDEVAIKHTDLKYRSYLLKTAYNVLQIGRASCRERVYWPV